jgi:PST family polysaccharide transporter
MTFLQFLNSLFYLIIYPIVIRSLGVENYGKYVFSLSIVTYFIVFISFGFDLPALNKLSKAKDDIEKKSRILSEVLTSKGYLFILSTFVFCALVFSFTTLTNLKDVLLIIYLQVVLNILMPNWYYQGIQKMNILTYIQVISKILSIPFIYLFVRSPQDLVYFALIITIFTVLSGFCSILYIIFKEKISINLVSFKAVKCCLNESLPFFWSSSASIVRVQGTNTIIGLFIGMNGLAIFDLASKIILLPQALAMNINTALFPSMINSDYFGKQTLRRIIKYEFFLGMSIVLIVTLLGEKAISILGGNNLLGAYPVTIILSTTIPTWIMVSCYTYFLFLPGGFYKIITYNQLWAFAIFFASTLIGLALFKNVLMVAIAAAIAGLTELIYCRLIIKKYNLL